MIISHVTSIERVARAPNRIRHDMFVVGLVTLGAFGFSAAIELNENWLGWTRALEPFQVDELPVTFLVLAVAIGWFAWRRLREFGSEQHLRQVAQVRLDRTEEQYRMLSRRYLAAQESERRHLARDLHDELGQYLNAIKIDAVSLRERSRSRCPELLQSASTIVELNDHVYRVVRAMMGQLRPVALDELGLIPAVHHCVDGWRTRMPNTRFDIVADENRADKLGEHLNITLFRLVQECLTNIARHSAASQVTIAIELDPVRPLLRLEVQDNGVGMDPDSRSLGLGLIGMRDRVESISGVLSIVSAPGRGVRIEAVVPIEEKCSSNRSQEVRA